MRCLSLLLLSVFLLGGCSQHQQVEIKIERYSSGKVSAEIPYVDDTLEHGTAKHYYLNGNLMYTVEYNYGVKEGWHTSYRSDGTMKASTLWLAGEPYGLGKWYYKNGQVKTLNIVDFKDKALYVIQYDSLGNKIKEEGIVFSPMFQITPSDTLQSGEEVMVQVAVAVLPEYKTVLRMGLKNKDMQEVQVENYTATWKNVFREPGEYQLVVVGEMYDKSGELHKRDSISKVIWVANPIELHKKGFDILK